MDGSPCKSRKTHALVSVSCSCCPITSHKSGADRGRPIAADILDGAQQNLVEKQIVDVPVSRILVEIVEACRLQASGRQHGWTYIFRYHRSWSRVLRWSGLCPIQEKIVEVIKVILREQCQRMRFYF